MPRMVDLAVTAYWWIPGDAGIADIAAPSAAVLTPGANISELVVASTKIGPTASDKVSEKSITDTSNAEVPIIANYEGNLVMFRDLTAGVPTANDPLTTIASESGVVGWIVRREGFASTVAATAAQKVDVFKFMTDNPQTTGGQGDGYLKAVIPLLQQGSFKVAVALAA